MIVDRRSPSRRRRARAGVAVLALSVAFLTACGNDSSDADIAGTTSPTTESSAAAAPSSASTGSASTDAASDVITVTAVDFSFSLDQDSVPAGSYELRLVNDGGASHDLVVERDGDDVAGTDPIGPGEEVTLTVDLEPGEYVFYCSIANHRSMGMEITVTVT